MTHILVTGGAGFIGSNLIRELFQAGNYKVTCLDNFDTFYDKAIKLKNIESFFLMPDFNFVEGDVINLNLLKEKLTDRFDVIVHLAAKAGVRPSIDNPVSYQQVNYLGTQLLLEFAREKGITQFVFASSSSVYGLNQNTPWSEEDCNLQPISPYAASKLACEGLGHVYSHLYKIRFLALRFFTVYGPGQRPDLAIHKFARMLMQGDPITLYGTGNTRRDYTYVDDIVQGILGAIHYQGSLFERINIGNNHTISLKDLLQNIEITFNKKANLKYLPEQDGDVSITYANIEKAGKLLNYQPKWNLQPGLKAFKAWFDDYYALSQMND